MRSSTTTIEWTYDKGVRLIVQNFKSSRYNGYDGALFTNLQHEFVSNVHVLFENDVHVLFENNDDRNPLRRCLVLSETRFFLLCSGDKWNTAMRWHHAYEDKAIWEGVELLSALRGAVFGSRRKVFSLTRHQKDISLHRHPNVSNDVDWATGFLQKKNCGSRLRWIPWFALVCSADWGQSSYRSGPCSESMGCRAQFHHHAYP